MQIKGTGEGVQGQSLDFLSFAFMLLALIILFPKWALLSLNSRPFSRYDATKLGPTRTFSGKRMGKFFHHSRITVL